MCVYTIWICDRNRKSIAFCLSLSHSLLFHTYFWLLAFLHWFIIVRMHRIFRIISQCEPNSTYSLFLGNKVDVRWVIHTKKMRMLRSCFISFGFDAIEKWIVDTSRKEYGRREAALFLVAMRLACAYAAFLLSFAPTRKKNQNSPDVVEVLVVLKAERKLTSSNEKHRQKTEWMAKKACSRQRVFVHHIHKNINDIIHLIREYMVRKINEFSRIVSV